MTLSDMSVKELAEACQEETIKFQQQKEHDTRYCFELFRRAFIEGEMMAFNHVYEIYLPQVERWVHRHPAFERVSGVKDAQDFASEAVMNFHQALQHGEKFNDFTYLAQVLQYLKMCVHSAICQEGRRQPPEPPKPIGSDRKAGEVDPSDDSTPEADVIDDDMSERIWKRLEEIFPDEKDRLLCRCSYIYGMKPRDIAEEHPDLWDDARAVSVDKQRIQRNIFNDPIMRMYFEDTISDNSDESDED